MRCYRMKGLSQFGVAILALALMPLTAVGQGAVQNVKATAGAPNPTWVPYGEYSQTILSATATAPTPDEGSTLQGPYWNWTILTVEYSDDGVTYQQGGSSEIDIQNASSATTTLQAWFYQGAYWRITCQVTVGYSEKPGATTWTGTASCAPELNSGELVSITVTSGASQTNVTGAQNWAAVKTAGAKVTVTATVKPATADVAKMIKWTGGTAADDNLSATVDGGTSAKTAVTAQIGTAAAQEVDIWIIWATIQVLTTNPKPANAPNFGDLDDGTENLGAVTWDNGNLGAGKICAVGTITPAGVHNVVTDGWNFRRDKWRHDFKDGAKIATRYDKTWQGDDSDDEYKTSTPDNTDKIYDIDGPNIFLAGTDSTESLSG